MTKLEKQQKNLTLFASMYEPKAARRTFKRSSGEEGSQFAINVDGSNIIRHSESGRWYVPKDEPQSPKAIEAAGVLSALPYIGEAYQHAAQMEAVERLGFDISNDDDPEDPKAPETPEDNSDPFKDDPK